MPRSYGSEIPHEARRHKSELPLAGKKKKPCSQMHGFVSLIYCTERNVTGLATLALFRAD
jgi:hypothetical protein